MDKMENTGVDKMQCNDDCNYDDRCCAQAAAGVELAAELVPASTSCYCCIDASSLDVVVQNKDITTMSTSFEPLKVCLDDDSSIEDSDDDMFDDDAFTFGDEEFQALMSHESMKRVTASIKSQLFLDRSAPNLSHMDANAHLPLHQSSSIDIDKAADSLPSTAASSQVRLPWLGIGLIAHDVISAKDTFT